MGTVLLHACSVALVAPVVDGLSPVLIDELDGARLVLVLVLLVPPLALDIGADGWLSLVPAGQTQLLVDVPGGGIGIALELLEAHLVEVALGDELLLLLIGTVQARIYLDGVLLYLVVADTLQLSGAMVCVKNERVDSKTV